jgi:hypothetical protein
MDRAAVARDGMSTFRDGLFVRQKQKSVLTVFNQEVHMKNWKQITHRAMRAFLGAAVAILVFHAPPRLARAASAQAEPDSGQSLEDRELEIDKQHLHKIFDAIQAYKKQHGDLPNWLSDLYPEFLSDPNILMSPVEVRTGQSSLWGYPDPKMKTSYVYEFSQASSRTSDQNGRDMSMKEKKMIQMEEYGPVIPLLRCHLYQRVLNLAYSGENARDSAGRCHRQTHSRRRHSNIQVDRHEFALAAPELKDGRRGPM